MIPSKERFPEKEVNPNFQKLLDKFHMLILRKPQPEAVKKELMALKEEAKNTFLTPAQRDAIIARCLNYLNGTYGSSSREYKVHEHKKS